MIRRRQVLAAWDKIPAMYQEQAVFSTDHSRLVKKLELVFSVEIPPLSPPSPWLAFSPIHHGYSTSV
jgi:hypothetical protein